MTATPNILLIVTDQERAWETLPQGLTLPARERLRRRGIAYSNYHVNAVACSPSRSTIYTGQHIQRTGVYDNVGDGIALDPARTPTLGQMLQCAGYHTVYAGKWHLTPNCTLRDRRGDYSGALVPFGFDLFRPVTGSGDSYGVGREGHTADKRLARWVRRWFSRKTDGFSRTNPWFLAVNFVNPHDIMFFDATGRQNRTQFTHWAHMKKAPRVPPYSDDLGFDLPENFTRVFSGHPAVHYAFVEDAALTFGAIPYDNEAAWRRYQNYYFNCLRDVDDEIATVIAGLEESGAADNTIVIFTSDHGEMAAAHGMRSKGPVLYRENFGVPLVVCHPDVAGGVTSAALFSAVDLAPTILRFAGVGDLQAKYPVLVGYDMSESLTSPADRGARAEKAGGILLNSSVIHASNPAATLGQMQDVRSMPPGAWPVGTVDRGLKSFLRGCFDGRHRFGRYFEPGDYHFPHDWETLLAHNELELYDTASDFRETNNLAREPERHRELILTMNAKLNALIADEAGADNGVLS